MSLHRNHNYIKSNLTEMFNRYEVRHTTYSDFEGAHSSQYDTKYDLIDGKTIKFWNIFPYSGAKLDALVYYANEFLRPFGLFLAWHNYFNADTTPPKIHLSLLVKELNKMLPAPPIAAATPGADMYV